MVSKFKQGDIAFAINSHDARRYVEVISTIQIQNKDLETIGFTYTLKDYDDEEFDKPRNEKKMRHIEFWDYIYLQVLYWINCKLSNFYFHLLKESKNKYIAYIKYFILFMFTLPYQNFEDGEKEISAKAKPLPRFQQFACRILNDSVYSREPSRNRAKIKSINRARKYLKPKTEDDDIRLQIANENAEIIKVICQEKYFNLEKQEGAGAIIKELKTYHGISIGKTKIETIRTKLQRLGRDEAIELINNKNKNS